MFDLNDLPTIAEPNTSREKRDGSGKVIQRRYYGQDGKAVINIDDDHDHGAGVPHGHDWDWSQDPPLRMPGRTLTARENGNL